MAVDGSEEVVKALTAILKNKELLFKQADTLKDWCTQRFTTDRWLDENEREWYALDRACRSRPWATRKDEPFKYPFREATNQMRAVEGAWVGDDQPTVEFTRGDAPCDVIVQVHMVPHCHADHRVLLFAPEFGSHTSFDMESWGFIEPDEQVDLWVVSWQGWTDFDTMIPQVVRRVLSFGDGVNTVWFGQGAGAIVAYEVLKRIEGLQTPNYPIALLVSDCPAPEEFQDSYKPYTHADFPQLLENPDISDEHRSRVAGDVATMATYAYKHGDAKGVNVPIIAFGHEDDTFVPAEKMQAWEAYSGKQDFEYVDLGEAQDLEDYVQGQRYTMNADPTVLETLTATLQKYDRWIEDGKFPDIGDVNAPLPDGEVDVIVVGAGIAGIYQANELAGSGLNVLCLDKYHEIGGVWNYYGNDYSKVNTSEIGYRIVDRSGKGLRPNEDHSPRRDIMRDIYVVASQHSKGKIRCNIEVLSVDRREDDRFDVKTRNVKTNEEKTIIARGVSFQVNRRIGDKRIVDWPGSDKFRGDIFYGYGNAMKGVSYHGKKVLVVGAGAFAFENVRTAVELGARHVTLLGRRDGTTCPKWIDMLAFLRPLDQHLMTHRSGNMISFETWQNCYKEAGLRTPKCWDEGLLKPNNHTISVSDLAFIAGFHGMFKLECGEIDHFKEDGLGVELKDGTIIDCDMIVKCTGFLLNDEVPKLTGLQKMQPYGLIERNLNYFAEPLLDGGQFGAGGKDKTAVELDFGDITPEQYAKGMEVLKTLSIGFKEQYFAPAGNPFGSGQGGPIVYLSEYFTYMMNHQEEQEALLKMSGKPPQDVVNLWASQIAEYNHLITTRLVAALGKMALAKEAAN